MVCKVDFQNADKLPLHELNFQIKENGVQLKVPALHCRWLVPRCYTKYRGLPLAEGQFSDQAACEEWLNESEWFNKDMEHLLGLEHFRFWSTLVFDPKSIESVISFLQEATPHYISIASIISDQRIVSLYLKILNNVLKIICRMITNRESETEWIRREHIREMLYSKFLISVPMLFDLIVAYGQSNINLLSKIIQTIFRIEPKYNDDLKIGLKYLVSSFKVIQNKTESEGHNNNNELGTSLDDLALYTLDCAVTLSIFLEVYPEARVFCNELNVDQSIAQFYDNGVPLLYKNIYTIDDTSKSLEYLNCARIKLLKAFRLIIYTHIENILANPSESLIPAESFIAVLTECLAERTFVVDYQKYFPVANDIEILKQACKELDLFKTDFILRAYTAEGESYLMDLIEKEDLLEEDIRDNSKEASPEIVRTYIMDDPPPFRDIVEEVRQVLDLLPHLGDGFIRRVLGRYERVDAAVSAILEDNLPPDLIEADQTEVYIPLDPRDKAFMETGIQRLNIYDGDKYDVMTQDNPECIIKTGKGFPGQPRNAKELLDDKSHVREMKSRYQEYSLVSEDNEYEDEYDDSYDALADSEAKTKAKALQSAKNVVLDEIDDEESEEDTHDGGDEKNKDGGRDRTRDFCENPEDVRARYEARRNMFFQKRPAAAAKATSNATNVVGKSKGQGQEKDVVLNRRKKETTKSTRANHNRKSGASWKRNRGMIPS